MGSNDVQWYLLAMITFGLALFVVVLAASIASAVARNKKAKKEKAKRIPLGVNFGWLTVNFMVGLTALGSGLLVGIAARNTVTIRPIYTLLFACAVIAALIFFSRTYYRIMTALSKEKLKKAYVAHGIGFFATAIFFLFIAPFVIL